jgi:hypothetical protein
VALEVVTVVYVQVELLRRKHGTRCTMQTSQQVIVPQLIILMRAQMVHRSPQGLPDLPRHFRPRLSQLARRQDLCAVAPRRPRTAALQRDIERKPSTRLHESSPVVLASSTTVNFLKQSLCSRCFWQRTQGCISRRSPQLIILMRAQIAWSAGHSSTKPYFIRHLRRFPEDPGRCSGAAARCY